MERRLAAILSADVAGFTRLMERDEIGTVRRLGEHWSWLTELIAQRGGVTVKLLGDGALVRFPSVEGALDCAVDALRELAAREASAPEDQRMSLRVGVNVGDVILEGAEVYGEAVNVATRIQEIAAPGSVVVTRSARDHLPDRFSAGLADLGYVALKHVTRPVRAYQISIETEEAARDEAARLALSKAQKRTHAYLNAGHSMVAAAELGGYTRPMMAHYEGEYICVRPSFGDAERLAVYRMAIEWSEAAGGLAFLDLNPGYEQRGRIAAPLGAPFLHFLTLDRGSARLVTAQHMPAAHGHMLGMALTLANPKGRELMPAAAPILIARLDHYRQTADIRAGLVDRADPALDGLPLDLLDRPLVMRA